MIITDFTHRTYTAEVILTKGSARDALGSLARIAHGPRRQLDIPATDGGSEEARVSVVHGFIESRQEYHRTQRVAIDEHGQRVQVPRRTGRGRNANFLYDVLLAASQKHIVIAVPFHELAEEFFVRVDRILAGRGVRYEKLNITELVVQLGSAGVAEIEGGSADQLILSITRCHLAYSDRQARTTNLQQIRMTGGNLGITKQYKALIRPVLGVEDAEYIVTPIILGFALSTNGVRKSTATTDRHGNFKIWISPGIRRLTRLFWMIEALESLKNVTSTTVNIPILQSKTIRTAEE